MLMSTFLIVMLNIGMKVGTLSIIMLSLFMLDVVILSVLMLNFAIMSIVAPSNAV
jgi:hypothetical protein